MLLFSLGDVIASWGELYRKHALLQSGVTFVHIAALVTSGGLAIATDRVILRSGGDDEAARRLHLKDMRVTHRTVATGLGLVFLSGLLLFLADLDTFLGSKVFWGKMILVGALLANGLFMLRAETAVERDPASDAGWIRMRRVAAASLTLWLLITLAGATLVNVQ
jgi:hypothetical protein